MVAAIPLPAAATPIAPPLSEPTNPPPPTTSAPSEKDNSALSRKKPHAKEISSRFLPSSSSSSTSTSQCTPSPLPISSSSGPKRSHSIDWRRPSAAALLD